MLLVFGFVNLKVLLHPLCIQPSELVNKLKFIGLRV